ncbi:MAG: amidohydrolase family protein [Planctomycetota bacterium]
MNRKLNFFAALFCLSSFVSFQSLFGHDGVPAPPQSQPVALVGGTVHTISGQTIENGTVIFEAGKLTFVGGQTSPPAGAKVIDVTGKHVFPGMFEANSHLGLTEISSVPATIDTGEVGEINPNVKAQVAINPDSELFPVTRAGGVLLAVSAPMGGTIAGRSAVIQLDGWTYEDMSLMPVSAMHMTWPGSGGGGRRGGRRPPGADEGPKPEDRLRELNQFFADARAYREQRKNPQAQQGFDLRLESMADLLDRKIPMVVTANRLADIQGAVAFAVDQNIRLVILGGYDAPLCADLLKKHDVPVIVSAVYRLPQRASDPYDHPYTLPKRLNDAGVRFCISCTDRSESWNTRNLPFEAGTAVAYGLPVDQALKAITLYPAQIFSVADRVGSLEVGKDATLFVSSASPLDIRSKIERAYIQGRELDLSNKQTRLYEKYTEKYRQLKARGK